MRRDRFGEPLDEDEEYALVPRARRHVGALHVCDDGWIDRDSEPARPCLECKYWLDDKPPDELADRSPRP